MKITWLGQAELLFDNVKTKIMVGPYLSNSVEKVEPNNFLFIQRRLNTRSFRAEKLHRLGIFTFIIALFLAKMK